MAVNTLLAYLDVKATDKVVTVSEDGHSDANFIITHLVKDSLEKSSKLCLVVLHNTLGHYHNVLKRLNCDLLKNIQEEKIIVLEPLKTLIEDVVKGNTDIIDVELFISRLYSDINSAMEKLLTSSTAEVHFVIDDISHLSDLGGDIKLTLPFINRLINFTNDDRIRVVVGVHVSDHADKIVRNSLAYVSDLFVETSVLTTGRSRNVTGVIDVHRSGKDTYHYKATEKEIKVFCPGESLYHLYK